MIVLPGYRIEAELGRGGMATVYLATQLSLQRKVALKALAHAKGIVHRDIKPANILLQDDGSFVLADFGIARMIGADRLTQEGSFAGTPAYMAPEQWRHQTIDARTDLYSLGVVFFQALTGQLPYDGDDGWAIGMQHQQAPLPRLPADYAALQELLAGLLAEELIFRLGRLRALTVIARSSSFPLQQSGLTAIEIGARLRASHLLACSIRPAPNGVRIIAELVETTGGTQRWSAEYDRADHELLAVVDELAVAISERLLLNLAGPERARLIQHRTGSVEAIALVEQARALVDQMTLGSIESGRKLLDQALAIDPDYARAYLAQADAARAQMQLQQRDLDWWRRQAEPLLLRALQLDSELPGALVLRSQLRCAERDWAACKADIDQALSFGPGLPEVRAAAAEYHMTLGSRERAVEHAQRLLQIEPESPRAWNTLTRALLYADRGTEALAVSERSLQRFAEHWPSLQLHALALEQLGRCRDGMSAQERALTLSDAALELDGSAASLYVCADRRAQAQAMLRALELRRAAGDPISDLPFALVHLALDQKEQALAALESMQMAGDPRLWQWISNRVHGIDKLAGDPRFLALVERLHLPAGAMNWQP